MSERKDICPALEEPLIKLQEDLVVDVDKYT